ncbi:hypothetical protein K227x_42060 [Rubripirellula lacrimiformis]|uniref:Uncharacterized protein n=1 Tax=Rubripirellula lacrimiformis TaxID=1930273 RepID=A0A517NF91_9BACT|nr:hypothetical protein [Rubripirellula lacrimiformis]QDT05801.1 hypothetical protein K227x_42060 [Rubripirellula lacrimiformis]
MEWAEHAGLKTYEIEQISDSGALLQTVTIEADSGESAAKQLKSVADGAQSIRVCLDGDVMNEMGVDYWQKRVRRR